MDYSPAQAWEMKVDRLAEVAVTVGLGLARGQELVITAPLDAVAVGEAHYGARVSGGAALVTTLFTDDEATLARIAMHPMKALTARRCGCRMGWPPLTGRARRVWRLRVQIQRCWVDRIQAKFRARTRRFRKQAGPRWSASRGMKLTGRSWPPRRRLGRS